MNQKGFTLIEMLVALAVGTVILLGVVGAIFMVMRGTPDLREKVAALADIERAAHWLTRDVTMGQETNLVNNDPPVSQMTVTWNDYTKAAELEESVSHSVSYTWSSETGELERNYDGSITIVGSYLTNVGFSINDSSVTVVLTSSINGESSSTITRSYEILMRVELSL
jgi:prepilin-type N-terminal cleavage/methylation domain-containing protein